MLSPETRQSFMEATTEGAKRTPISLRGRLKTVPPSFRFSLRPSLPLFWSHHNPADIQALRRPTASSPGRQSQRRKTGKNSMNLSGSPYFALSVTAERVIMLARSATKTLFSPANGTFADTCAPLELNGIRDQNGRAGGSFLARPRVYHLQVREEASPYQSLSSPPLPPPPPSPRLQFHAGMITEKGQKNLIDRRWIP